MSVTPNTAAGNSAVRRELPAIPPWAWVAAAFIFTVVPMMFYWFVWTTDPQAPAPVLQVLIGLIPGTILGFLALMIGYVNRDAGRRGMSRTLWTVIVIFVPNGIGFILYFLMRQPLRTICPNCATIVDSQVNYCPACRHSFRPTCTHCKTALRHNDKFCANCGVSVQEVG